MEKNTQNDFLFKKYPIDRTALGEELKNLLNQGVVEIRHKKNILIDAKYGFGKTTFMKCLQNDLAGQSEPKINTFFIDLWEYEYVDEPLFGLLSALEDQFEKYKLCKIIKGLDFSVGVSSFVSVNVSKSSKEIWKSLKNLHAEVNTILNKLCEDSHLLIFVDELDRVSPHYAVKSLERIKHFFDHPKITFVVAMNLKETIRHINDYYGSEDGDQYIEKTLRAETVRLPSVDVKDKAIDFAKEIIKFFMPTASEQHIKSLSMAFQSMMVGFEGNLRNFESLKTHFKLFECCGLTLVEGKADLFFIGLYLLVVKNISGQFGDISEAIKEGKAKPIDIKDSILPHFKSITNPSSHPPRDTTEGYIQAFCDMFARDAQSCVDGENNYFSCFGYLILSNSGLLYKIIVEKTLSHPI